mmetsp:Transcript_8098/g.19595  ORF Transcript_8098/g.19595 Transcript_8098/m.19595 type:complete len:370 (-) Transcript_8098:35-1144(-)
MPTSTTAPHQQQQHHLKEASNTTRFVAAAIYVLSGCSQPIIMRLIKDAGLSDPTCQLYMLFFYLGPSFFLIPVAMEEWPSKRSALRACGVSMWDLIATGMNYMGAALAGPAIFGIVYSSVAIWTAVLSRILVKRRMSLWQWACVFVVFSGLALTAVDASHNRNGVRKGAVLVLVGSMMHGLFYVMSEYIMTHGDDRLTARQNCAIQNSTAMCFFFVWQILYTMPRADEKLWQPMEDTETTLSTGISFLVLFGVANLIHAISFYYTLKNFPGGATSAGVMKGLQAVLVFVFTHLAFCGRRGGLEMCFSKTKFISLVTVVGGVVGYGLATEEDNKKDGYQRIESANELSYISGAQPLASGGYRDEENTISR